MKKKTIIIQKLLKNRMKKSVYIYFFFSRKSIKISKPRTWNFLFTKISQSQSWLLAARGITVDAF